MSRSQQQRHFKFEMAKTQCLGKRDKSFAGRIDPRAVEICALINERPDWYTTSSCSGRCFLYRGRGTKACHDDHNNHDGDDDDDHLHNSQNKETVIEDPFLSVSGEQQESKDSRETSKSMMNHTKLKLTTKR